MPADKFPGGTVGILKAATNENEQEDVFLHCDPRMVAVNVNGDPELGSLVYDLNGENEYDAERGARLQSMMRVIKKPMGAENALAWQLGGSGQGDTGGGWVIDGASGSDFRIGAASVDAGGPFDVGDGKCKHQIGKDADGNSIASLHISTNALFRKNNAEDGPIRFEDAYEEGDDGWKPYPVHIAWTGVDWAPFVKLDIGGTPTKRRPFPLPFPHGGAPTKLPDRPWQPPWEPTGKKRREPPPAGGGDGRPTFFQPRGALNPQLPNQVYNPELLGAQPAFNRGNVSPTGQQTISQSSLETRQDLATPGLLARAQTTDRKKRDLAHMPSSAFNADQAAQAQFAETPISGQMMAFAAQGGTVNPGTGYAESVGGSGDPWKYTKKPGKSRFYAGTASGGWVFLPPEVQAGDYENGYVPDGITLSTTYVLVGPGAYFGAGIPDTVKGGVQDGWTWGMDSSTGDLLFRRHSNSDDAVDAIKFELSSGDIYWKSGTSYYGRVAHAITAARTWTFPDKDGTVAMTSDITGGATWLYAYKTANQSKTNTTTPADDSELVQTLTTSAYYSFRFKIFYTSASATAGIKFELSGTCTITSMKAQIYIYDDTLNSLAGFARVTALDSPVGAGLSSGDNYAVIEGTIAVNAGGTFLLQWAQNTADAVNAVTVQAGSVLEILQVG